MTAWGYPRWCAHRGAGKLAPENTLAALRLGHAHGYRMAEFDVKLSADGVAFLLHDATLDRTTGASGRADALPWRELALLDAGAWHSPAHAGEPLPTLAGVARYCRANGIDVNIEIKPTPGRERETGAAVALDAAALWAGAARPPLLSSFSDVALQAALESVPGLPRAWLCESLPADWLDRCRALGCVALDAKHTLVERHVVDAAHAAGLAVATWTVNDPARARALVAMGVDTIITDAVDVLDPNA
ncbi:MAG TPA: glycerophosphodiester phosphodiesterase [Casimicrobiaceae bacterium]|nr:glycerophosphodiester phosphodiesterase [Casimicrobiaceae bacterium]